MTLASLFSHPLSLLSPEGSPQMITGSTIRCVSWNSNHWDLRILREKLFGEKQIKFTTWGWSWGRKLPGITWRHHDAQSRSFWAGPQVLLLQSSLLRAVYGMATKKQDSVPLWTSSCEWRSPFLPHYSLLSFMPWLTANLGVGNEVVLDGWSSVDRRLMTADLRLIDDWCTAFALPCSSSSALHVGDMKKKPAPLREGVCTGAECLGGSNCIDTINLDCARYLIYTY